MHWGRGCTCHTLVPDDYYSNIQSFNEIAGLLDWSLIRENHDRIIRVRVGKILVFRNFCDSIIPWHYIWKRTGKFQSEGSTLCFQPYRPSTIIYRDIHLRTGSNTAMQTTGIGQNLWSCEIAFRPSITVPTNRHMAPSPYLHTGTWLHAVHPYGHMAACCPSNHPCICACPPMMMLSAIWPVGIWPFGILSTIPITHIDSQRIVTDFRTFIVQ